MSHSSRNVDALLEGFTAAGGWINKEVFTLRMIESMGFGAVAVTEVQPDTPLFHIPNHLILSPLTSTLRQHLTPAEWSSLGSGWTPLILVMMWESSRQLDSPWSFYLNSLPTAFETPMFWTTDQVRALRGTDIEKRIGRDDAESEYHRVIAPILAAHPDLFPPSSPYSSLDSFHLQGSRILSRSFTIPVSRATQSAEDPDDSDDEDADDNETAVMIPMADMLNAAYERDNARLYDDEAENMNTVQEKLSALPGYTMVSTQRISCGQQIFNTYSSPPNSELLRKYGHVDTFPFTEETLKLLSLEEVGDWPHGNPGDEVELEGSLIVDAVKQRHGRSEAELAARVDRWLEEGQDESFYLTFDGNLDDQLVAFIRVLLNETEWKRFQKKGKLPPPSVNSDVHDIIQCAIQKRLAGYEQSLSADLTAITADTFEDQCLRRSAIVRIGEKRLLHAAVRVSKSACTTHVPPLTESRKRAGAEKDTAGKRSKR